jgi:hypothetical protein
MPLLNLSIVSQFYLVLSSGLTRLHRIVAYLQLVSMKSLDFYVRIYYEKCQWFEMSLEEKYKFTELGLPSWGRVEKCPVNEEEVMGNCSGRPRAFGKVSA